MGFGGQRQNHAVVGVDHRRSEHLVEVCRRSVTVMLDATFLALDLVRGAGAGAVDSDQIMTPEHGPVLKNLSALQTGKNSFKGGPHAAGVHIVKAFPHPCVGGNLIRAKQRLKVLGRYGTLVQTNLFVET